MKKKKTERDSLLQGTKIKKEAKQVLKDNDMRERNRKLLLGFTKTPLMNLIKKDAEVVFFF